jgi:2,3,4,5-tetrahydropyridine-2-carboxylate N-succinyltransferase
VSVEPFLAGDELLAALESGEVRAAAPLPGGEWRVDERVKRAVLALFASGALVEVEGGPGGSSFLDKDTLPVRGFARADGVRLVPGGSAVRRGAHVARGAVLMPPCYVNIGAWIGEGALIDSHALVGSCAQVGARVHVSAGAQLGGVLEPVRARPVIVEDDCLIGANCGLFDGVLVRAGAVLGAGTILTASTPVYDLVHELELRADAGRPLEIPARAVVVPGTRPARGAWARAQGLSVACALLVKFRDERT